MRAVGRLGTREATSDGASAIIDASSASIVKHVQFAAFELAGRWRSVTPSELLALARMIAVAAVLAVAGCSLLPDVVDETTNLNAEQIYKHAHDAMVEGNYTRAIKLYETLEARFPYGRYAQQAILERAYANYRAGETAAAIAACDRFIRTYPNHPNVDYAYYLKGLVYFREDQGLLGYVYELDLSEREPKAMRESFAAFKELVAQVPGEPVRAGLDRPDAAISTNALGMYEVNVARYYYNRGALRRRDQSRAGGDRRLSADAGRTRTRSTCSPRATTSSGSPQLRDDTQRDPEADVSGQHLPRRDAAEAVVEALVDAATSGAVASSRPG